MHRLIVKQRTKLTFQFGYVTTIFVEKELRKLKRQKSTGIDSLPPGMLKDVAHEIAHDYGYETIVKSLEN